MPVTKDFAPDVHKITAALDEAIAIVEAAHAAAEKAHGNASGADAEEVQAANLAAMTDARRQLSAFEAAKKAVAANCCSNFQDCPISVMATAAQDLA